MKPERLAEIMKHDRGFNSAPGPDSAEMHRHELLVYIQELEAFRIAAFNVRLVPSSVHELIDPEIITPARIRAYLTSNGWRCIEEQGDFAEWVPVRRDPDFSVVVRDIADDTEYTTGTAYLVRTLADYRGVGVLRVLDEIGRAQ